MDDEQIREVMQYKCFWQSYLEKLQALKSSSTPQPQTAFSFAPPTSENNNNASNNTNGTSLKELNPATLISLAMHKPSSNDFVFGQSSTTQTSSNDMATEQFEQELIPFSDEEKEVLRHLPRKECK